MTGAGIPVIGTGIPVKGTGIPVTGMETGTGAGMEAGAGGEKVPARGGIPDIVIPVIPAAREPNTGGEGIPASTAGSGTGKVSGVRAVMGVGDAAGLGEVLTAGLGTVAASGTADVPKIGTLGVSGLRGSGAELAGGSALVVERTVGRAVGAAAVGTAGAPVVTFTFGVTSGGGRSSPAGIL